MLIKEFFNFVLLVSLTVFLSFFSLVLFLFWSLFLHNFVVFLLVKICSFGRYITKFMHLKELFDPFSSLIKHSLLYTGLFSLFYLVSEPFPFRFELLFSISL